MKEKRGLDEKAKKGLDHPFAHFMGQNEKILWMDGQYTSSNSLKTYGYVAFASLLLWAITLSQIATTSTVLSTSCACLFLILIAGIPIVRRPEQFDSSSKGMYALTNRHLFYWNGEHVTGSALEDLPEILLIQGAGSQGTLTFDGDFPAMLNIDDAAYVKTMIEQAQNSASQEISHERKE